jgi:hypothetical protein
MHNIIDQSHQKAGPREMVRTGSTHDHLLFDNGRGAPVPRVSAADGICGRSGTLGRLQSALEIHHSAIVTPLSEVQHDLLDLRSVYGSTDWAESELTALAAEVRFVGFGGCWGSVFSAGGMAQDRLSDAVGKVASLHMSMKSPQTPSLLLVELLSPAGRCNSVDTQIVHTAATAARTL